MIVGRVVASVVSTEKHPQLVGHKLLMVQPLDEKGRAKGKAILALDAVQAGEGDRVLVVDEGGSARNAIGDEKAMIVRTVILGIVDRIDIEGEA
ncbi:MAG TPA: EutN/CcmL family microcompartment protein [Rectinemataceae bacterium]|nr:EutN/CcmL family microcompartment protein [Rectinemataceae bacterium]